MHGKMPYKLLLWCIINPVHVLTQLQSSLGGLCLRSIVSKIVGIRYFSRIPVVSHTNISIVDVFSKNNITKAATLTLQCSSLGTVCRSYGCLIAALVPPNDALSYLHLYEFIKGYDLLNQIMLF